MKQWNFVRSKPSKGIMSLAFALLISAGAALFFAAYQGYGLGSALRLAKVSSQDTTTSSMVHTAFFLSRQVSPFHVQVETDHAVVTLKGEVPSEQVRQVAGAIAADTSGVRQVINNLVVNPAVERNPEIASLRDRVADLEIRTLVADALSKNSELKDKPIETQVQGGTVTLTGVVETPGQRDLAEQTARAIPDVRLVTNDLKIQNGGATAESQDDKLARTVEFELYSTKAIPLNSVQIHSRDGVVTLTGTVRERAERLLAEKVAASVDGVKRVVNDLALTDEETHAS